jgi:hypothetical protein
MLWMSMQQLKQRFEAIDKKSLSGEFKVILIA